MKRCSLCGGRLDLNKRCTLCGLDNTQNDEQYKHLVNQSDCEHGPLTHVHTEPEKANTQEESVLAKVISVIVVLFTIISFVFKVVSEFF